MPRGQASRSLSGDKEPQQPPWSQVQQASDHVSMARFTGEASSSMINGQDGMAQQGGDGGDGVGGVGGVVDGNANGNSNGNGEANGDGNIDVEMGGDGQHDADGDTPTAVRARKRKRADVEEVPANLNELRLLQLEEDRDAYRYDMQWCQDVLDQDDITPVECRTYQMRLLDLGHQLRLANHSISQIEAEMQNLRFFGSVPPSYTQPPSYTRPTFIPALNHRAYIMDAEPPQERRGPGRPPGSKNRRKDASATPQPPSSNAQKAAAALASAGAKRTLPTEIRVATTRKSLDALPCESCCDSRRMFAPGLEAPLEITCAAGHRLVLTPRRLANGRASGPGADAGAGAGAGAGATDNLNKRLSINVGSPIGSATEDDNDVNETTDTLAVGHAQNILEAGQVVEEDAGAATSARRTARTRDTTKEDDRGQNNGTSPTVANNNRNINASSAGGGGAAPVTAPSNSSSGKTTGPRPAGGDDTTAVNDDTETEAPGPSRTSDADPTAPGGPKYKRLGHHMCQLCTTQRYLMQTTPKMPSEPSSWPLRDISKMITHYTRMHGEHNKEERCMELGRAIEENRGPFRYWLTETKRVKITPEEVNEAIQSLHEGRLPEMLRRLSNSARSFPMD